MNPATNELALTLPCPHLHRAVQLLAIDAGFSWVSHRLDSHASRVLYSPAESPQISLWKEGSHMFRTGNRMIMVRGYTISPASIIVLSEFIEWLNTPYEP